MNAATLNTIISLFVWLIIIFTGSSILNRKKQLSGKKKLLIGSITLLLTALFQMAFVRHYNSTWFVITLFFTLPIVLTVCVSKLVNNKKETEAF